MDGTRKAESVGGVAVLGAMISGAGGVLLACTSMSAGHFEAAALALLAAAVAFVGVANVVFRH